MVRPDQDTQPAVNLPGDIRARREDDFLVHVPNSLATGRLLTLVRRFAASPNPLLLRRRRRAFYHMPPQTAQPQQFTERHVTQTLRAGSGCATLSHRHFVVPPTDITPRDFAILTRLVNCCWSLFQWGLFLAVAAALGSGRLSLFPPGRRNSPAGGTSTGRSLPPSGRARGRSTVRTGPWYRDLRPGDARTANLATPRSRYCPSMSCSWPARYAWRTWSKDSRRSNRS